MAEKLDVDFLAIVPGECTQTSLNLLNSPRPVGFRTQNWYPRAVGAIIGTATDVLKKVAVHEALTTAKQCQCQRCSIHP